MKFPRPIDDIAVHPCENLFIFTSGRVLTIAELTEKDQFVFQDYPQHSVYKLCHLRIIMRQCSGDCSEGEVQQQGRFNHHCFQELALPLEVELEQSIIFYCLDFFIFLTFSRLSIRLVAIYIALDCKMEFDSDYEEPKFDEDDLAETGYENVTDVTDGLTKLFKKTKRTKPKWKAEINSQGLRYKTGRTKVGLFVIFWQVAFGPENFFIGSQVALKKRNGSGRDVILLEEAMKNRGFDVLIYKDMVKREVESKLAKLGRSSFEDYDMFGMAITSHGDEKGVIYVHDSYLHLNDFVNAFKVNKTLLRKPKARE